VACGKGLLDGSPPTDDDLVIARAGGRSPDSGQEKVRRPGGHLADGSSTSSRHLRVRFALARGSVLP
jgi:hypothetical protein